MATDIKPKDLKDPPVFFYSDYIGDQSEQRMASPLKRAQYVPGKGGR
jgi:hypothetical protein